MTIFSSLHMKEKHSFFKSEKFFEKLKMDKKNVQIWIVKTLLTDEIFLHDVEKLSSQFKRQSKFL